MAKKSHRSKETAKLPRLAVRKPRQHTPLSSDGSPSTGVSFLITHHQKAELRERGFTDDQIHTMTPEEAHRLLGLGD
jgi:predicted metal-dependent phosphotriesterase family hydrolase